VRWTALAKNISKFGSETISDVFEAIEPADRGIEAGYSRRAGVRAGALFLVPLEDFLAMDPDVSRCIDSNLRLITSH
jgi:hypothetical protein